MCDPGQSEKTYARYDGTHCDLCESVCFVCVDCSRKVCRKGQVG
jgi:hypothetical protein